MQTLVGIGIELVGEHRVLELDAVYKRIKILPPVTWRCAHELIC